MKSIENYCQLCLTPTTRMFCGEEVMRQEGDYLGALQEAERYEIRDSFLYIYAAGRPHPLRFIRAEE